MRIEPPAQHTPVRECRLSGGSADGFTECGNLCENDPSLGEHTRMTDTSPDTSVFRLRERTPVLTQPPYQPAIPGMLEFIAQTYGGMETIVRGDVHLSYRELERQSRVMVRGLLADGVGKGSRMGLLMPDSPDFAVAFMAAARIGAVVLPMTVLDQAPEIRWVLHHADIDTQLTYDRDLSHNHVERLQTAFPTLAKQHDKRLYLQEAPYLRRVFVWHRNGGRWAQAGPGALIEAAAATPVIDEACLSRISHRLR
jgi:non-ribosomal peptide synthetase component F